MQAHKRAACVRRLIGATVDLKGVRRLPPTKMWSSHALWGEDPVMAAFKDMLETARGPGWPGPSSKNAAEVLSKHRHRHVREGGTGLPGARCDQGAHAELAKVYAG
jgi:multiple sugar transport system substrate-binding protein